jgi:ABC-type lipoprotein export system ATPase subunit
MTKARENPKPIEAQLKSPAGLRQKNPVLLVDRVTKNYQSRCVLNEVGFSLAVGERVSLVGPSGCGKTTLLNCVGGIDRVDRGAIRLGDVALEKLNSDELAKVRREQIGTVFQFFHLLPTLTAFENIELPLQLLGVASAERRQRVDNLLARVKLSHRAEAVPGQLSGGEMQRVAIARALSHRPRLILADEPTGNLDSVSGEIILDLLAELCQEHQTALLMVTHSAEASRICHRTLQMRDGVIIGESEGGTRA